MKSKKNIDKNGSYFTVKNGLLNSEQGDSGMMAPAFVLINKVKKWYKEGKLHRDDEGVIVDTEGNSIKSVLPAVQHEDGTCEWWQNGKRHRIDRDSNGLVLPAIKRYDGSCEWWIDGLLNRFDKCPVQQKLLPTKINAKGDRVWLLNSLVHRTERDENGMVLPAFERINGHKEWWVNGKLHRDDDLPAIMAANGSETWYKNGKIHRTTRDLNNLVLPAIQRIDGHKEWWIDGVIHRVDIDEYGSILPAIISSNGTRHWYANNKRHRIDGPAICIPGAESYWFWDGQEVTKETHPGLMAQKEEALLNKLILTTGKKKGFCL